MADPTDEDAGDGAVDLFRALGRQIKVGRADWARFVRYVAGD
ncbi:hypothetical protein [Streptomyces cuspidosporus]|uniref:Uncharacterized protein n=1 Tax=Streptomyces cuspidosporus TaxID=66882 RepID=A0ABP5U0X8_9ACTN